METGARYWSRWVRVSAMPRSSALWFAVSQPVSLPMNGQLGLHGNKPRLGARLISICYCKVKPTLEMLTKTVPGQHKPCYTKHTVPPSQPQPSDFSEERLGTSHLATVLAQRSSLQRSYNRTSSENDVVFWQQTSKGRLRCTRSCHRICCTERVSPWCTVSSHPSSTLGPTGTHRHAPLISRLNAKNKTL